MIDGVVRFGGNLTAMPEGHANGGRLHGWSIVDGPVPTMATVSPGFTCPFMTPHSKPVGKMSLSHHEGFFVSTRREAAETTIGVWDAHVLVLSSVKGVAQNPAVAPTMGIHASSAEVALQAASDARDYDLVSNVKLRDASSDLLDYTNALVAENASIGHHREISLQNVKIGSANRRSRNPHDGIALMPDGRARLVLPCTLARTVIDQRFHGSAGASSCGTCSC